MMRAISTTELAELVRDGLVDPAVPGGRVHVFDVRAADAFTAAHVPGSDQVPEGQAIRWIPQQAATTEMVVLIDDDGVPHGAARHVGVEIMHNWFRRVRFLEGGFRAWHAAGQPVEQDGIAGPGAASAEGRERQFKTSAAVPWDTPDPSRVAVPIPARAGKMP